MDGWMNQAYSRLSNTHGHITDCKLLVCMYWTRLVLVRPAASLYTASPLKHHPTGNISSERINISSGLISNSIAYRLESVTWIYLVNKYIFVLHMSLAVRRLQWSYLLAVEIFSLYVAKSLGWAIHSNIYTPIMVDVSFVQ